MSSSSFSHFSCRQDHNCCHENWFQVFYFVNRNAIFLHGMINSLYVTCFWREDGQESIAHRSGYLPKPLNPVYHHIKKKMITLADFSFSIGQFVASWSVIAWCNINTYPHVLGIYPDLSWWLITGLCFTKHPELSFIFIHELPYQSCWMTMKFCTCHDSIAVVACAKFHFDQSWNCWYR